MKLTLKNIGSGWISLLVLFKSTFSACAQTTTYDERLGELYNFTVPLVKADSLASILRSESMIILDTRSEKEFETSHIANAQFVNYDSHESFSFENFDKNTPIVVYCSVGYRSEKVGEYLQQLGFTRVSNLYGGIFEWKNTDHPVVNMSGAATDSVHTYNERWSKWLEKGIKIYE